MSLPWTQNWSPAWRIRIGTRPYYKDAYTQQELKAIPQALQNPNYQVGTDFAPSNARLLSNLAEDGMRLRELDWELDATNSLGQSDGNEKATLKLYNINDDLISVITQQNCVVIMEAGYGQQVQQFYVADVMGVKVRREDSTTIHELNLKSNGIAIRDTVVNINYDEAIEDKDVIVDLAGRFSGAAIGTVGVNEIGSRARTGGRTFVGSLITSFDREMEKYNLSYAHINGKVVITPYRLKGADYDAFSRTNYNLSLDSIISIEDESELSNTAVSDEKGSLRKLKLNTFFIPIEPSQFVTVPDSSYTKEYAGTYQVKGVRFFLSTVNPTWQVAAILEEV